VSYADFVAARRRREILKLLAEDAGHASERVLYVGLLSLGERTGVDPDYVRAQLVALKAKDCITTEMVRDDVMVAHITARGAAVLRGQITVDGVAAPDLGE
jgi:hypothetical protein